MKLYMKIDVLLLADVFDSFRKQCLEAYGGVSQCSSRYAIANNKYMTVFNESGDIKFIVYLDTNNLYGWGMAQPLPYGGFEWVTHLINFDFNI